MLCAVVPSALKTSGARDKTGRRDAAHGATVLMSPVTHTPSGPDALQLDLCRGLQHLEPTSHGLSQYSMRSDSALNTKPETGLKGNDFVIEIRWSDFLAERNASAKLHLIQAVDRKLYWIRLGGGDCRNMPILIPICEASGTKKPWLLLKPRSLSHFYCHQCCRLLGHIKVVLMIGLGKRNTDFVT